MFHGENVAENPHFNVVYLDNDESIQMFETMHDCIPEIFNDGENQYHIHIQKKSYYHNHIFLLRIFSSSSEYSCYELINKIKITSHSQVAWALCLVVTSFPTDNEAPAYLWYFCSGELFH